MKYSLEILVATMHQTDYSLIKKMNIQGNAIIINQCDHYSYHLIDKGSFHVKWYNVNERGLSKSRNVALSKSTSDICLLVDDDEVLKDNYERIIIHEFERISKADLITFNLNSIGNQSNRYVNKNTQRLHIFNIMRYGSARIAFKRNAILNRRILFAPNFGAGTSISCGEDSIFLHDCLMKGIKAYSSPSVVADIDDGFGNSSWFKGYTEKYFVDLGSIYAAMSPITSELWIIQYLLRHRRVTKDFGFKKCFVLMNKGKKRYKKY